MTVFISTCCIKNKYLSKICNLFYRNNIKNVKLSAGYYQKDVDKIIKKFNKKLNFQTHNYFPVPKKPFVFNLASEDPLIVSKSIKHAIRSIRISSKLNRKVYSFHAGYLVDPSINDLGKHMKKVNVFNRNESIKRFIKNVKIISLYAKKYGVKLLIENNVISKQEVLNFKKNIVLMADPKEINLIFSKLPSNVKMLLDVAHFKVSSNSLNFPLIKSVKKIDKWIQGYHLSDNNGLVDSNKVVTNKSWFWPIIKRNLNYYTIEVYNLKISQILKQKELVEKKLMFL